MSKISFFSQSNAFNFSEVYFYNYPFSKLCYTRSPGFLKEIATPLRGIATFFGTCALEKNLRITLKVHKGKNDNLNTLSKFNCLTFLDRVQIPFKNEITMPEKNFLSNSEFRTIEEMAYIFFINWKLLNPIKSSTFNEPKIKKFYLFRLLIKINTKTNNLKLKVNKLIVISSQILKFKQKNEVK